MNLRNWGLEDVRIWVGQPTKLFAAPLNEAVGLVTPFDAHPDGKRFLVQMPVSEVVPTINVILNWQELLKK